jgi:hypothetical protein
MKILDITTLVSQSLGIDAKILNDIIETRLSTEERNMEITDNDKLSKIQELLKTDSSILDYGERVIRTQNTKNNFNKLKENLGKLQIFVLIRHLEKSKNCDGVLNSLLEVMNNKFEQVNSILQKGGGKTINLYQDGETNYYQKYLKYKIKYFNLKNKI